MATAREKYEVQRLERFQKLETVLEKFQSLPKDVKHGVSDNFRKLTSQDPVVLRLGRRDSSGNSHNPDNRHFS
jgi:hypothetical protein